MGFLDRIPFGKPEEKKPPATIAGAEVMGKVPTEITVEKDGKVEKRKGEISVLLDEHMESGE